RLGGDLDRHVEVAAPQGRDHARQGELPTHPDRSGEHEQEQPDHVPDGAEQGESSGGWGYTDSVASTALAGRLRSSIVGRSSSEPPSRVVEATSMPDCSSRMLRGGGKYSSSSVIRTTSTPSDGASRVRTCSTSSSGADAPAVTPTTPARSSGSSS